MKEIPKTMTVNLSQCQRFIIGLEELANECGMTNIEYNSFAPLRVHFNDGSSVGMLRAFFDANIFDEEKYMETYKHLIKK